MKIAFVTPEFITEPATFDGGLANYLYRISLALVKLNHTPHVFVGSDRDEVFDKEGIIVHRVKPEPVGILADIKTKVLGQSTPLSSMWLQMGRTLNKRLEEVHLAEHFDIVQHASYGAMGYHRSYQVPSVTRLSSYEPLFRAAKGITDPSADERAVENNEKVSLKRADAVFGPSKLTAETVEREIGISVKVIESPFILDTQNLDESVYQERLIGKKYLLFWGTLSRLKGIRVLAEILPELLAAHPDLHFVFVGKAEPGIFNYLPKDHNQVIYLERLPHTQLYPIIKNAYAAVLPSLYDNFPNTCIEGMAFGRVVIGTRGASFDQLISDGESGILCEKDDPQSLKQAIERALSFNDSQRQEIGEKAMKRIELLKPETIVEQLINFYSEVINKSPGH